MARPDQDRARIGGESEPWRTALCSFAPKPGEPHCNRDTTWHGMKIDEPEAIAMESCDHHLPVMLQVADYAHPYAHPYVHPYVHPYGIPGAVFCEQENQCSTEWDEQAEFAQAELALSAPATEERR